MVENSEKKFSLNGFVVMKIDKAPAQSRSLLKALAHSSERVEITLEMYSKSDVSSLSDVERIIDFLVVVLISIQEIPFSSSIVLMAFVPNFFDIALNFSSFDLTFASSRAFFMSISRKNFAKLSPTPHTSSISVFSRADLISFSSSRIVTFFAGESPSFEILLAIFDSVFVFDIPMLVGMPVHLRIFSFREMKSDFIFSLGLSIWFDMSMNASSME